MRSVHLSLHHMNAGEDLAGRVIAVTGAGSGLGLAAAQAFAAHGASVVLMGRRVRPLEQAYDAIVGAGHPQPFIHPLDLAGASADEYTAAANGIAGSLGALHGLLHSAATLGALAPLEHCEPDDWMQVMQVNLNAAYLLSRACLPLLRASGDARLLFTTAGVGRAPRAYWGAYAVAKAGVEALAGLLAEEEETDGRVRVACIDPGRARTRMHLTAWPGLPPDSAPEPVTLAPAYLHFMGPPGRDLHGCRLEITG